MFEVGGCGHAQLCVFMAGSGAVDIVVSRVSQVILALNSDEPWIFDAAALLIRRFSRHDGSRQPGEMKAVVAAGVAQRRRSLTILRAIEEDELATVIHHGGIKSTCGLKP